MAADGLTKRLTASGFSEFRRMIAMDTDSKCLSGSVGVSRGRACCLGPCSAEADTSA